VAQVHIEQVLVAAVVEQALVEEMRTVQFLVELVAHSLALNIECTTPVAVEQVAAVVQIFEAVLPMEARVPGSACSCVESAVPPISSCQSTCLGVWQEQ